MYKRQLAEDSQPLEAGSLDIINTRNSSGLALLEFDLPITDWNGPQGLRIANEADEIQGAEVVNVDEGLVSVQVVTEIQALSRLSWTWSYTSDGTTNPQGSLTLEDVPEETALRPAFVDVQGKRSEATVISTIIDVYVDDGADDGLSLIHI